MELGRGIWRALLRNEKCYPTLEGCHCERKELYIYEEYVLMSIFFPWVFQKNAMNEPCSSNIHDPTLLVFLSLEF